MKLGVIVAAFCVLGAAGAGAYWYGNQPVKEYYPNGTLKSLTERKMYEPLGKTQLYAQNGKLIEEYNQNKGIKNGKGTIYFNGGTVDFNYANNKLSGPLQINVPEYAEIFGQDTIVSVENSELKIKNGDFFEINADIACDDSEFISNMQKFSDEQNYTNFKNFFGCLNIKQASINVEGGNCEYAGSYQFPEFLADSSINCDETNAEFLQGYAQGFNLANSINTNLTQSVGVETLGAGEIGNIESLKFNTEFKTESQKLSFSVITDSDKVKLEQTGSFGGFEEMVESGVEFAYSPQEESDVKKLVLSIFKNMTWSDWSAAINGKKRFTISGDFNMMDGFSNPYVMSYYSNGEVTTQWKIDDKGTQLTSKYPNSNKPLLSFGMSINDGFKKAYKSLMTDGLNLAMGGASTNQLIMNKVQKEAIDLLKGINSVSGVLMNVKGEKTISGAIALQKNFSLEQLMMAPQQFLIFKVITYQDNKPFKIYDGNLSQGFKLNGSALPPEQYEAEINYLTDILKGSFDGIMAELEKAYADIDEANTTWINSDVDPFLFGLYKGYTVAQNQPTTPVTELNDTDISDDASAAAELSGIVENIHILFAQSPDGYTDLNSDAVVALGIVPHNEKGVAANSFGGKIVVKSSPKTSEDQHDAFVVAFSGIPDEECESFLHEDIFSLPPEEIIAVSAGKMTMAPKGFAEINKLLDDDAEDAGIFEPEQGYMAVKIHSVDDEAVQEKVGALCSGGEKGNFLAVKYY